MKPTLLPLIALGAAVLTGCGPAGLDFNQESASSSAQGYPLDEAGCHAWDQPNITPLQDTTNDGSRYYSTCFDPASPNAVVVRGHSSRSDWVCAFPVRITGFSNIEAARDSQGIPISLCWDARSAGAQGQRLSFLATGFTGLVVVDYPQKLDMSRCLMNGQTCPYDYSVGAL